MNRYHWLDCFVRIAAMRRVKRQGKGVIAVYLVGHMGDLLVAGPMLKRLREAAGGRRIVWLVGGWGEGVARRIAAGERGERQLCDEMVVFSPDQEGLRRGNDRWRQGAWEQWKIVRRLAKEGVWALVSTRNENPVVRFLANGLRPKIWVGLGDRRPPRVASEVAVKLFPYDSQKWEVEAMAELLGPLGMEVRDVGTPFWWVTPEEEKWAEAFLREEGAGAGKPLVLLSPGSGWRGKNWGGERFGKVAEALAGEGMQIAWIGTTEERPLMPAGTVGLDWFGRLDLCQLAAVMKRAALWIGNDSGAMHLAAAAGCKTLSLWGPTDAAKWAPRGKGHVSIRKVAHRCSGCVYWDWRSRCQKPSHECMDGIGVQEVVLEANKLLRLGLS